MNTMKNPMDKKKYRVVMSFTLPGRKAAEVGDEVLLSTKNASHLIGFIELITNQVETDKKTRNRGGRNDAQMPAEGELNGTQAND